MSSLTAKSRVVGEGADGEMRKLTSRFESIKRRERVVKYSYMIVRDAKEMRKR